MFAGETPMTDSKRPLKVFLCHASADKPRVRELYTYLKKHGIQPWLDEQDLLPGQDWQVEIPKAIEESDVIIICLSKNSVDKKGYVQKEIRFALDKALEMPEERIFIIPARLEECRVPRSLNPYQWVDLFNSNSYAKLMKSLQLRAVQLERGAIELLIYDMPIKQEKKSSRKLKTEYVIAIIGAGATILAALIGIVPQYLKPVPAPTMSVTSIVIDKLPTSIYIMGMTSTSHMDIQSTPTFALTNTITATKPPVATRSPTITSFGYTIVDPQEVFALSSKVKALGELAKERYSVEDRNKINKTLIYTIEATQNIPMFWRWYWCAATEKILNQNLEQINVLFEADGHLLKPKQLAQVKFKSNGDGWVCFTYSTVLKDWKPGTYHLVQTMTIKSAISDGKDSFPSGYKIANFTITIR